MMGKSFATKEADIIGDYFARSQDVTDGGLGSLFVGMSGNSDKKILAAREVLTSRIKTAMSSAAWYDVLNWRKGVATIRRNVQHSEAVTVDTVNCTCTCHEHRPGGIIHKHRQLLSDAGYTQDELIALQAFPQCKHELIVAELQFSRPEAFRERTDATYSPIVSRPVAKQIGGAEWGN